MIRFPLVLIILASSYYTFTYGRSLWVDDQNKIGAIGAALLAITSIAAPIYVLFFKT